MKRHRSKTRSALRSREVTPDDLDGLWLLQLNAACLEAVLILLEITVDGKWVPGKPILHWKAADILVLLFGVVLDVVNRLVIVLCRKKSASARCESSSRVKER